MFGFLITKRYVVNRILTMYVIVKNLNTKEYIIMNGSNYILLSIGIGTLLYTFYTYLIKIIT